MSLQMRSETDSSAGINLLLHADHVSAQSGLLRDNRIIRRPCPTVGQWQECSITRLFWGICYTSPWVPWEDRHLCLRLMVPMISYFAIIPFPVISLDHRILKLSVLFVELSLGEQESSPGRPSLSMQTNKVTHDETCSHRPQPVIAQSNTTLKFVNSLLLELLVSNVLMCCALMLLTPHKLLKKFWSPDDKFKERLMPRCELIEWY